MFSSLEDIEFLDKEKCLGQGGFAKVFRVQLKKTKEHFALKIIDLKGLNRLELLALKNEIGIHQQISHEQIVSLKGKLMHQDKLYILLDYIPNNSLYFYIDSKNGFQEEMVA